ncbi:hypothetical protein J4Q44_G00144770 [Coregonus suidteri]|uniref:Uncharacterized protein n=1 Tax=Coregonus suidteri TaxID=861788 RepID=A0AAN8LQR1_9TELE
MTAVSDGRSSSSVNPMTRLRVMAPTRPQTATRYSHFPRCSLLSSLSGGCCYTSVVGEFYPWSLQRLLLRWQGPGCPDKQLWTSLKPPGCDPPPFHLQTASTLALLLALTAQSMN